LAEGRIWRWFAVNIPMDLGTGTGGTFTRDIDIIAKLHDFPRSKDWLYRTWEVKVNLLCKDGSARSIKIGKLKKMMAQLKDYKAFGAPSISLLDIYLCEAGFMVRNSFPPPALNRSIKAKLPELNRNRFGYQLLPFEHGVDENGDFGLLTMRPARNSFNSSFTLLRAASSSPRQPFLQLADAIDKFFDSQNHSRKSFEQIVFCRNCRRLQLISMKNSYECPTCQSDLIIQS
jgi:hypothetical protein